MTDDSQTTRPDCVRSVWDNGGRSMDRYTVVIEQDMGPNLKAMLGMSADPGRGFSQFGECVEGDHLGRRIDWGDLPAQVRRHAAERLGEK